MDQIEFRKNVIRPVECYREAWTLIKDQFWMLLAIVFIAAVIGSATLYVLFGAMMCGMFYCYLRVIDGKGFAVEDLFKGFRYWFPGLVLTIVFIGPTFVLLGILYIPTLVTVVANPTISPEELLAVLGVSFAIDIVLAMLMVCLHTLLMFSYPLIVDREMSAFEAIKTSARAVWANLNGVAGLYGVGFLLSLLGMLVFCVGIYLVLPIIIGANALAYRKVFPSGDDAGLQPPAPEYYRGLV